ncbi:MAG: putative alcohol dehydrogenase protein [Nitrososphaera sp.]|jgi:NADPH:quinone reductase-like Zn-dependent oxidoreductase|nr:putative alcohol dehydrogenase protein [Nitrososphaera sp.]
MKAVAFFEHGPVDVLQYHEDFPDPVAGRDEVLIDIKYCAINHLDIWTRQGIGTAAGKKIRLPHICGCDIVGTTPAIKGQRVMIYPGVSCGKCQYCTSSSNNNNGNNKRENLCNQFAIIGGFSDYNGGYAEQVAVPEKNVIRLPSALKDEAAATLAVSYLTAWNMLQTNGVSRKKKILVYGASSGVGMATIQLAEALGATVITTVSSNSKQDFAKKLGAHYIIDRTRQDIADEIKKIVPAGVDIVIDHVGAATWATSIAVLRQGGRMAVCGMTSGNEATVPVRMFYTKQIVMVGSLLGTRAQLEELINFVMRKKIQPVIDSVFPLQDAKEAQKKMEAGRHTGKILLKL